jgi:rod shape-determining protein MreB
MMSEPATKSREANPNQKSGDPMSSKREPKPESQGSAESTADAKKDQGVLYLGVDLGTSRTTVTASNGVRDWLPSFVGYPKDVVSRKLLKKDVLFGQEAIEKRLSLDLYRPLAHGVLKFTDEKGKEAEANLKAACDLIAECIRRARPRRDELVYAVIGAPAQASIQNKEAILKAARESVDSVMLCSEPFAVAYGLDWLEDVLVIDIGAGTTDLCRMHGTMPEDADQITINYAGDYIDQRFYEGLQESCPDAQFTVQMIKQIKERSASVAEEIQKVTAEFPVQGKPTSFDVTRELRDACRSIIPPIVEGLGKLVATFDPEFQDRLKQRVLIAGGGSQINGLDFAIEQAMRETLGSGKVIKMEEPIYGGANGALKIAHDMPAEYWEKLK